MSFREIFILALQNIKANILRSALTLMIIALGIMALVGILTSIDAILYSMQDNFSALGANSFSINRKNEEFRRNRGGQQAKITPPITYRQSLEFKERFAELGNVSVSFKGISNGTIKYLNKKTNPTVRVRGIDENYFKVSGYEIGHGRNFSLTEIENGSHHVILGMEVVNLLFEGDAEKAINKDIVIGDQHYIVIGILKSKGSTMNESSDRRAFIPLINSLSRYGSGDSNLNVDVAVIMVTQMDETIAQAIGTMRSVRSLKPYQDNDFEIQKSDGIITFLKDNTVKIRMATIAIGLMTLLGAAIGLMNIMLVSVTERTKEIGIVKALGATKKNIRMQFLVEAILICQAGGILGVLLGIPVGNIVSLFMGGKFIVPWAWIILGLVVCFIVGVVSGFYPAVKASELDPVEALRYE